MIMRMTLTLIVIISVTIDVKASGRTHRKFCQPSSAA